MKMSKPRWFSPPSSLKKLAVLLLVCMLTAFSLQAQQTITGKVTDSKGTPLPVVNVLVKGSSVGVLTDGQGAYSIVIPANTSNPSLLFSFIGFTEKEELVGNRSIVNVTLGDLVSKLDEVVVVGYGVQKKVNLTGSVSSIKVSELAESRPITNLSTGLAGLAAGVQVNSANNRPGDNDATIRIRGQGTLNNASPLVIIDGVEGSFSSLNPQDVESMSILKDAASAAIYGSRAANGVVLIKTKKGSIGKIVADYTGFVSFESANNNLEFVSDYARYMELMNEGMVNGNQKKIFSQEKIDLWRANAGDPIKYPNTDVMKEMFKTSVAQNHVFSISGGSDKMNIYSSFGYFNNPGVMENAGNKRYSFRTNLEGKLNDWIKLGTQLNGYYSAIEIGTEKVERAFTYGATSTPGMVLRHPDGRFGSVNNPEDDSQANNPLHDLNNVAGGIIQRNMRSRFYATLTPVEGLNVTGSFTYDFTDRQRDERPVFIDKWNFLTETITVPGGGKTSVFNYNRKTSHHLMDLVANYNRSFFEKRLEASILAGASQEQRMRNFFQARRYDLLDAGLTEIGGAIGDSETNGYSDINWAMHSYFSRINLAWDNKYLFEANLRADGSSRFLKNNRWGYFPSLSAAWRMEQESFVRDNVSWLNALKIRASYGALGNSDLGTYDKSNNKLGDFSSLSILGSSNYGLNGALQPGLAQLAISNAKLTWETTYVTNMGIDFSVLANRLSGTLEYFNKKSVNILIDLPAPWVVGTASIPRQNSAEVVNSGTEFTLTWHDKIGADINYFVSGNLTMVANEVTKFKGEGYSLSGTNMIKEGLPINVQYIRQVDRLVQTDADMAHVQSIADNAPIVNGKKIDPFKGQRPVKGDLLYKDLNGDGSIDDSDRQPYGNGTNPRYIFGMTLGATWKGFDFSTLIQGATGVEVVFMNNYFRPSVLFGNQINAKIADGRWYDGRVDASFPRLLPDADNRNKIASDFWVQDKSYFKIRNIQLGYTLPKNLVNRIRFDKIRVFGSLENFFTFTRYDGLDPEVDSQAYPTMRQAVLGVNITF